MSFGRLVTIMLAALESVHNRDNAFNSLDHMSCFDGSFQTYAFDNRLMIHHHWVYDISLGFPLLRTLSCMLDLPLFWFQCHSNICHILDVMIISVCSIGLLPGC